MRRSRGLGDVYKRQSVSSTRDTARCRHLGDFGTRGELIVSDVGTAASEKVMPDGRTEGLGGA